MRIVFATSSFQGGGITSYAHEVVNCFRKNHEIHVIIGNDEQNPFDRSLVNVHICDLSDCSSRNAKKIITLINETIQPDIVFNSNAKLVAVLLPFFKDKIRVISVSHSLRYIEADITGINHKYSDNIIALSVFNKKYLVSTFGKTIESKICVIYNTVCDINGANLVLRKKIHAKPLKVVYAGGTSAPKSPIIAFKVLRKLLETDAEFEFYYLGNSTPTLKSMQIFTDISELLPKDKRFHITGRISRIEAEDIISKANIFFIPSKREGCPMAMLEAMRFGCILITSDYKNACREMVKDGENGFVIPHKDTNLFVSRIVDVVNNPNNYIHIYEQCYNDYNNKYAVEIWYRQMNSLIEKKEMSHSRRKDSFSNYIYNKGKLMYKYREIYNKLHMLLFETLSSAFSFYVINLKRIIADVYFKIFKQVSSI